MALEATHIRFALDIKDKYRVQDMEKYISGSVYPDSRYVTGIDRNLTHNKDIMKPEFAKDDFRKGWQAHQICDIVQSKLRLNFLPELFPESGCQWNEDDWVASSAVKIIQDTNDLKCFDLQSNLKYLEYAHNPNGEDLDEIKKYNRIFINMYKGKSETTIEDNIRMWLELGINGELGEKIKIKTEELLRNEELVGRIHSIYKGMIKYYNEVLR